MDILVLLVGEVHGVTASAIALVHIQLERLCLDGLVGIGANIIIGELHRRNGVLSLVARNSKEVIDHVSLYTISRQLGLVGHLRIIFVEVLGEVHHGLLDELQVTNTAYHYTDSDRIIGLDLGLVELS